MSISICFYPPQRVSLGRLATTLNAQKVFVPDTMGMMTELIPFGSLQADQLWVSSPIALFSPHFCFL
jgi:hypothetical protein